MNLKTPKNDEIPFGACVALSPKKTKQITIEQSDTRNDHSTAISELDLIPHQKAPQIFEFQEEEKNAENALLEEAPMPFQVNGADQGEQLTHILSAIWVLEQMRDQQIELSLAIRELTKKVRSSIS